MNLHEILFWVMVGVMFASAIVVATVGHISRVREIEAWREKANLQTQITQLQHIVGVWRNSGPSGCGPIGFVGPTGPQGPPGMMASSHPSPMRYADATIKEYKPPPPVDLDF